MCPLPLPSPPLPSPLRCWIVRLRWTTLAGGWMTQLGTTSLSWTSKQPPLKHPVCLFLGRYITRGLDNKESCVTIASLPLPSPGWPVSWVSETRLTSTRGTGTSGSLLPSLRTHHCQVCCRSCITGSVSCWKHELQCPYYLRIQKFTCIHVKWFTQTHHCMTSYPCPDLSSLLWRYGSPHSCKVKSGRKA